MGEGVVVRCIVPALGEGLYWGNFSDPALNSTGALTLTLTVTLTLPYPASKRAPSFDHRGVS